MSSDIDLYNEHPEKYSELQNLRPDYRSAIETTVQIAAKYLNSKTSLSLVDFCGGTGNVTKKIAEIIPISKATIIDINNEFLNIAKNSNIKVEKLETIQSDILKVKLKPEFDLVLSIFAYHHVPDNKKMDYLKIALEGMKKDSFFILTEIYLPDQEITRKYYEKLLNEIPIKNPLLKDFLTETADSKDFEFKVSKEFADKQLKSLGLKEVESVKIYPLDETFGADVGTFVQVFKK